jgi:hypothetical protein
MAGIFDTGIFDTGIYDHEVLVVVAPPAGDNYSYAPSSEAIARMYALLFGKRKKPGKPKRKARLEKVALDLIREIDPGPDLPPLDVSALVAAIKMLDAPVKLKPTLAQKSEIIEALLAQAQKIRAEDEDMEEIMMLMDMG